MRSLARLAIVIACWLGFWVFRSWAALTLILPKRHRGDQYSVPVAVP